MMVSTPPGFTVADGDYSNQCPGWMMESVMATTVSSTLLACGGMFALSFVAIWAFWFVERLRGDSAPRL